MLHIMPSFQAVPVPEGKCRFQRIETMPFKFVSYSLILTIFSLFFFSSLVCAGGAIHGGKAAGMGTAFTAVVNDPSAILFNPAGLTQLSGQQIMGGATLVSISSSYDGPTGESEDTKSKYYFPPHLYFVSDGTSEKWAFGLGLHSPFGIGGRVWDGDGATRYQSTKYTVATLSINPTVSWQPVPILSFGAGLNYMHAAFDIERKVDQSLAGYSDGSLEIGADGGDWGWNVGMLIRLSDTIQLGAAYRSSIKIKARGDVSLGNIADVLQPAFGGDSYTSGVSTKNEFPEIYSFGLAVFPNRHLTLALDVDWVRWSSFDNLDLIISSEVPPAGFVDISEPLHWDDSWQIKFGGEWSIDEMWAVRCGYAYVPTYVPESTMGPANPDADQHNVSLGIGIAGKVYSVDFFGAYSWFDDRDVNNDILNGTYGGSGTYFGFSYIYQWAL